MPEIIDAVYDQLLEDKDVILDMIIDELIAKLGTDEDYDTIRRRIREEEIKKMLEQLQD